MKFSGITRRIDELGRIVVPKEMRYNLGIRDGEPLEIYVSDNSIIIKKFSQIGNIRDTSQNLCDIISDICNVDVIVTDREKLIAVSNNVKHLKDLSICEEHKRLIDQREAYISIKKECMYDLNNYFTILPIITSSDSSGLVIIISNEKNVECIKYAKIIQRLIINKLDIS